MTRMQTGQKTQRREHTYCTVLQICRFHFKKQSHGKSTIEVKHYTSVEQIVQCLDQSDFYFLIEDLLSFQRQQCPDFGE